MCSKPYLPFLTPFSPSFSELAQPVAFPASQERSKKQADRLFALTAKWGGRLLPVALTPAAPVTLALTPLKVLPPFASNVPLAATAKLGRSAV